MILRDEQGRTMSLMACPRCENYEQHGLMDRDDGKQVFQCGQCFATFSDQD